MNTCLKTKEPKRWMLVDDTEDILLMLSALLEHLTGATFECHSSPESALNAFAAAPDAYELVFTDYDMPGMNGTELCRRMLALSPNQKIVLTTGSGYFSEFAARAAGFSAMLGKPYPISALQAVLAAVGFNSKLACPA